MVTSQKLFTSLAILFLKSLIKKMYYYFIIVLYFDTGRYPCCGERAFRFELVKNPFVR